MSERRPPRPDIPGSAATSLLESLLYQDLARGNGALVIERKEPEAPKAPDDGEERLVAMAAAAGRLDAPKIFTLHRLRPSHTYNPLHLVPSADPEVMAGRVFSTFSPDLVVPLHRDQSRRFFVALVCALAATGKRFSMLDVAAAIASPEVLDLALSQSSDRKARRSLELQLGQLVGAARQTFAGLLVAVRQFGIPSLNAYAPDIVLEHELDRGGIMGFYFPAHADRPLSRSIALCLLRHVQELRVVRQLDRSRSQLPLYIFSDEIATFAYEAFTEAMTKLRAARLDPPSASPEGGPSTPEKDDTSIGLRLHDLFLGKRP